MFGHSSTFARATKVRPTWYTQVRIALILLVMSIGPITNHVECSLAPYVKRICRRIPIHTTVFKQDGDHGFGINLDGLPTSDTYRPGETYTVRVAGSDPYQRLMGVMVETTAFDKKGNAYSPGTYDTTIDMRVQDLREDKTCENSIIAHRYLIRKDAVRFRWTAPSAGAGCVHFNATVIEHADKWYKDEGGLHRVLCEESTQRDSASVTASDQSEQQANQDECCACGHAMYTVEFQGLWSRNTHPKGFPDEKNAYQLHWSNLVGASHSNDYRIWEYGQFSSRAVKEVCEYGSSRSLENELKDNSEKIRTVVKTEQLWGPKRILDPLKARYTVNKKKHLLSLITMVGPSPDWCLGVTAESMCTANCTWRDSLEIDLYPWDAGTDSRVTYLGRKMATQPPEKIHRLTSTKPNDRDSPFYGVDIKPFARLTLRKKKEACTDDDGKSISAEKSPTTEELVSIMKKKMMMNKKFEMEKCSTSQWSDWAECSNPCGSGLRERRRMLKQPGITAEMCDLQLVETESCFGDCKSRGKKLSDGFVMRHDKERDPTETCAVTDWSVWSPCSATCGLGMKERWRMFLYNPEQRVDCGIHLMEKDLCRGEIFDCQKAMMMKNFTAICQQPVDNGPCRGDFPRWFYNHSMEKCQTFSYGGCRGNENRFDTESECVDLCADHMASLHRNGGLSGKHGMSQQQREMEKVMMREKERMMAKQRMREKQETMNQDMLRKEEMMRKLRMMEQQRAEQERKAEEMKRQMMKKQMMMQSHGQPSSDESAARMEKEKTKMMRRQQRMMKKKMLERRRRRRRRQRKDDDKVTGGARVNCMVSQWSDWSECSATCGKGVILKSRVIKVEPKNGGRRCPRRLKKKKKCRQKKCPVDCKMSQWSDWSSCTQTCGDSSVQIRRRRRLRKPKRGGLACSSRKERRFCNVPLCPDSDMRERMRRFRLYHRRY